MEAVYSEYSMGRPEAMPLPVERPRHARLVRARERGSHTAIEWEVMVAVCGDRCVRCGTGEYHLCKDHIVPIYFDTPEASDAIDNLQPMCGRCNSGKGPDATDHRPADWRLRFDGAMEAIKKILREA